MVRQALNKSQEKINKKKPSIFIILLTIIITMILTIWGLVNIINNDQASNEHYIKVVINYDGPWRANIEFTGSSEFVMETGFKEYEAFMKEHERVEIFAQKDENSTKPLTVIIIDNGEIVREASEIDNQLISIIYFVGH